MEKSLYLVLENDLNKLIEFNKREYKNKSIFKLFEVLVIEEIEFLDNITFRIKKDYKQLETANNLYYFYEVDGYYNKMFTTDDYIYYCLDGCYY